MKVFNLFPTLDLFLRFSIVPLEAFKTKEHYRICVPWYLLALLLVLKVLNSIRVHIRRYGKQSTYDTVACSFQKVYASMYDFFSIGTPEPPSSFPSAFLIDVIGVIGIS